MVFHREVNYHWPPLSNGPARFAVSLVRTGVLPSSLLEIACSATIKQLGFFITASADECRGSQRSLLFQDAEKSGLGPVWSPRGDQVAFTIGRFFQSVLGPARADVAVMQSDGTGLKILTDGSGNYGFPSWSPDGKYLV